MLFQQSFIELIWWPFSSRQRFHHPKRGLESQFSCKKQPFLAFFSSTKFLFQLFRKVIFFCQFQLFTLMKKAINYPCLAFQMYWILLRGNATTTTLDGLQKWVGFESRFYDKVGREIGTNTFNQIINTNYVLKSNLK